MYLRPALFALLLLALLEGAFAQEENPLPVRKVVLYKNGMGYFQHLGEVRAQQAVEIPLTSAQLNDVLKSLTVLDLGGGQVTRVTYNSSAPLERRMGELPIDLAAGQNLVQLLNQIRGTLVEVQAPSGLVEGRLVGAETKSISTADRTTHSVIEISVLTENGKLEIVELQSAGGLKLADSALAADVARYLELLDSQNQRDLRGLEIHTSGSGTRQLFVSYTSEAPIWKSTYRIILDNKQKPLLQGWALVDNTTTLDWKDVELSLVAGAPVSFIQELSKPVYGQRPVVPLPGGVQVQPEVHGATLEESQDARFDNLRQSMPAAEGIARSGSGMRAKSVPAAPAAAFDAPDLAVAARRSMSVATSTRQAAEQFEYKVERPVTILRDSSALLPILQSDIEAEKVAVYNPTWSDERPRFAVWLRNTSGLTLDGGAFTVIDTNSFAGEGLLETLQAGERRLLSYALDLATEVSTTRDSEQKQVERIVMNRGLLIMYRKALEKRTYTIRNRSDQKRTLLLEHPVRAEWKLSGTRNPEESSSDFYRFRVPVDPDSTQRFVVQEEMPQQSRYQVSNITPEQVSVWVKEKSLDSETERALHRIAAKKAEISGMEQQLNKLAEEEASIFQDQQRVRENLNRLGRTPEEARLRQRYIQQMEQQEDRLGALRVEADQVRQSRDTAQTELNAQIDGLSFDREIG